jgi:hypothetical protein
MVSETANLDDPAKTRIVFGKALAALVAAQANWSVITEIHGAERQAIETWAAKAKVDLGKADAKARSKLLDVANTAFVSIALGSPHPNSEEKLGDLGLLTPRSYDIEIQNPLKSEIAEHGVTKREVGDAIHNPDAYQHLSPPPDFDQESPLISMFVRVLNRPAVAQGAAPAKWCFVVGRRVGRKVHVQDAYRISQATLTAVGASPLDLFRAFCGVYGCELMLGPKKIGKFLLYERVKGVGKIQANVPTGHKVHLSTMAKATGEEIELAFGYAIDLTAYGEAIRGGSSAG